MNNEEVEKAFTALDKERYFEDYIEGKSYELGEVTVDYDEMVEFSRRFDPQAMHIDEKEALAGPFKGIIASGWFTTSLAMKLFVCHYLSDVSSMASPGLDGLKWLHPVRGGDKLKVTATVKGTFQSRSKPDRGVVKTFLEVKNQNEILVMTIDGVNMVALNPDKLS